MTDALNQLRRELAGRYAVEQELGHGGMAIVYLATDLRHHRKVAIKVLRQDVGGASAERFLREIRTVAALHHPHILQLLDSGTAGDHLFYVMPYVEGETIRQRLERDGPLPVDEAVRIAREVADALAFAHARGVVHRDIKPENIFLSAGHALVADFGIARAADAAAGGSNTLTDAGLAVGTPSYMSPEQATAAPKLDGRSDQYALGCVLYEMLAGAPPFTGPTSQAIMARHMADPVPPLRTVRDVPPALESAITRSLAKMPADRWASVKAFAESLDRVLPISGPEYETRTVAMASSRRFVFGGAVLALMIAIAAWALGASGSERSGGTSPGDSLLAVVIAPFSFKDSAAALFADGVREQLQTSLSRVPGLRFPHAQNPRLHASRETGDDQREIAQSLGAAMVIVGEVQVAGKSIRVYPRIIDVGTGELVFQSRFDGELGDTETEDFFRIQDEMSENIVAAMLPKLGPERRRVVALGPRTTNLKAYELSVEARNAIYDLSRPGVERAIRLLDSALVLDSMFADAWLARAEAYGAWRQLGAPLSPADITSRIRTDLKRAIALDSLNGAAFAFHAEVAALYDRDFQTARSELRTAIKLSPGSAYVEVLYAALLNLFGQPDSALTHMRRAVALEPENPFMWANLGIRFGLLGWDDSAVVAAKRAIALDSTQWLPHVNLADAYRKLGRHAEARHAIEETLRLAGDSLPLALALVAQRSDRGQEMVDRLIALSRDHPVPAIYLSMALEGAGDREGALRALRESAANHDMDFLWFIDDLDLLHGDERYEKIRRDVFGDSLAALRRQRAATTTRR
jgi:TolB-like protein/Tfp pilus assembly protein PilF